MPKRSSNAVWEGALVKGQGTVILGSGILNAPFSFRSRFETGSGTNPEELLAAAHAGCYSMALAHALDQAGHPAERVITTAQVDLAQVGDGYEITHIHLNTLVEVANMHERNFQKIAQSAHHNCTMSKALAATHIDLTAKRKA